jgi:hypothetical protein
MGKGRVGGYSKGEEILLKDPLKNDFLLISA